jgi:hypothetical protein
VALLHQHQVGPSVFELPREKPISCPTPVAGQVFRGLLGKAWRPRIDSDTPEVPAGTYRFPQKGSHPSTNGSTKRVEGSREAAFSPEKQNQNRQPSS